MLSVVIPAHNEETELPDTLAALRRALDAQDEPWEIVVVDDDSTDRTAAIARDGGAAVVEVRCRQIAAARNAGARATAGEMLLFVDADTRVSADVVAGAVRALREGAAGGGARVRFEPPIPVWARVYLAVFMMFWTPLGYAAGCFLFARRDKFEAVGGFDEEYYASEEIWLSRALREVGRFVVLREPVLTSGRKVRMNSAVGILLTAGRLLVGGPRAWRRREGLELWYDGRREAASGDEVGAGAGSADDARHG